MISLCWTTQLSPSRQVASSTARRENEAVAPASVLWNQRAGRWLEANLLLRTFQEEMEAFSLFRINALTISSDIRTEDFDRSRRRAFALFQCTTSFPPSCPLIRQIRRQRVMVIRHYPAEGEEQDREVTKRAPAFFHLPAIVKLSKSYVQSSSRSRCGWLSQLP